MSILLHEVSLDKGILSSPYCWMVRLALAHKGLDYKASPTAFTNIPSVCGGGHKLLPVLEDGGTVIADSWAIAEHLDAAYPERPLFVGPQGKGYARFVLATFLTHMMKPALKLVAGEIVKKLQPQDRDYYVTTRTQRFGMPIEEFTGAPVAERLAELRTSLEPLRAALKDQPFLSGAAPLYADYVAAGYVFWWRAVSPEQVFEKNDSLLPWFARVLALYPRIAKDSTRSWDGP
jgi:glutathione S-transferase